MTNVLISSKLAIKFSFLLLFNLSFLGIINGQFLNDEFCSTNENFNLDFRKKPWKGNNVFLNEYLKKINYYDNIEMIRYRIPLKLWIYRKSDGTGGLSDEKIKEFIDDLNYYNKINHTGFRYYLREIKNIDKTNKLTLGYYLEAPLQNIINHTKGCLNIYIADTLKRAIKKRKVNIRGTYNIVTKSVIIQKSASNTSLTHEIGHYFGLYHPHRNYKAGKRLQESVSRTRKTKGIFKKGLICERNGDGLTDTPAEPNLTFLVDNNCKFTGSVLKDKWGDKYKSNTNNIMSYPTHYRCRKSFTEGQIAVMLYKASVNKYYKYWNTENKNNDIYTFDDFEPDDRKSMANILQHAEEQIHTFHKVYSHKSRSIIQDTTDWMKFEIEKNSEGLAIISVKASDLNKSELKLSVLFEDGKTILEKTIPINEKLNKIKLEDLKSGWYFIKIEKKSKTNIDSLENYTINVVRR